MPEPCLLDRLTNDRDSRGQRAISESRYREAVRRDLEWLFGASAHLPKKVNEQLNELPFNLEDYPHAFQSVINFGIRHLFGLTSPNLRDLQRRIKDALITFEPRIDPNSLVVGLQMDRNVMVLDVSGLLTTPAGCAPLKIQTCLDTQAGYSSVTIDG